MSHSFFDLSFDAMSAYNQVGFFIGALICLGLGGLLLGSSLHARLHAQRVMGRITGVRQKGNCYFPVYSYTLPDGRSFEATSDSGSSGVSGKETGRAVPLLIFPDRPETASPANSYLGEIIGLLLAAPGVFLLYLACTAFPITKMTFVMLGAMGLYGATRLHGIILPKDKRIPLSQWKTAMQDKRRSEMQAIPVQPIESIASCPDRKKQTKQVRIVLLLFAPLLIAGGFYTGKQMLELTREGLRAPGEVVSLEIERGSGNSSDTYHPVVAFTTAAARAIRFKDKTGSNPPMYRTGEAVTVLYLEKKPEKSAVIDHGIWNWLVPALLTGIGLLMLFGSLMMWRTPSGKDGDTEISSGR